MTGQEPAWLKRTRPCPFFSQGRCLFADSCNFRHDVNARSAVNPLSNIIQVKQRFLPPKLIFDPPSVVVNSASPRSANLAVPAVFIQDSARYSGLISVLSDVIGPPPNPPITSEDAVPGSRTAPDPSRSEHSWIHHSDDSEVTLDNPVVQGEESGFYDEHVAELQATPGSPDRDIAFYLVGDTEEVDDDDADEHMDDYGEEDPTVITSNRQSTFSSFTGASLLASPRNNDLGESSAGSPIEDSVVDLLSPVELSANLRPFPIPSPDSKVKRGDSIDSGYADWVGPRPFPRSPPRSFPSPATSLSHSQYISRPSPGLAYTGISHESSALHSSPRHPEITWEVESDERLEDAAYAILGVYDTSSSEEQGGDETDDVLESSRRHTADYRHPARECDLDSYLQLSLVSDDNLSFKTALSTQPSADDLRDIRKVSPVNQCSVHPSISGRSTPNTSVLSHYSDANAVVEQPIVDSLTCESSHPPETPSAVTQIDGAGISEALASECAHLEGIINSEVVSTSYNYQDALAAASDVQVLPSEDVDPQDCVSSPLANNFTEDIVGCAPPDANINDFWSSELSSSTVVYGYPTECTTTEPGPSLIVEESLGSECDSSTRWLSFPLPPSFQPDEFVAHGEGNGSILSETTVLDPEEAMSNEWMRSGSDLTEKARSSGLPSVRSADSDNDFTLRRSRAASDITVKASSPSVSISRSPPPAPEQPDQSDSVQSLYDEYFDADAEDCSNPHEDIAPLDVSGMESSRRSDSGTDPQSVLGPLLTAQKPYLRSPLAVVLKANLADAQGSFPTRQSTQLQVRGVGNTMVPLRFRRQKPQTLYNALPPSGSQDVLRIRTDMAREDLPPSCSSASQVSFATRSPLTLQSMSAPPTTGLKQLRLSTIINKRSSILSTHSSSISSSISSSDHISNSSAPHSPSVSSVTSFSRNSLLSSSCESIPEQTYPTLKRSSSSSLISPTNDGVHFVSHSSTRYNPRSVSAPMQQPKSWRLSHYRAGSRNYSPADDNHRFSRRTSTLSLSYAVDEQPEIDQVDPLTSCPPSALAMPIHAIATPKPTLLFAIASDDVDQVRQVLESGEAGPNDSVGPQSALAFTLTNDKLVHKQEIVKALLAYGANPSTLRNPSLNPSPRIKGNELGAPPPETTLEGMDPATRYFVTRADTAHTRQTSQLIYRSFFRPLTRVRYDVIGQDWALEQLFRILSMHSQKLAVAPIVVLLCGPSGHGKSLLARKFGNLLDVPTHTVNMTTLQSAHDIWQSYSMSPYEEPSSCTLAEFLTENEGKRCVVVLDEIEKVEDQKALWSLLMPWELGRCSLEAGKRHVDACNVIWLGTSNIGHELVFQHHENRAEQDMRMSREEYLELTSTMRPRVSHCLGASLVSRVTTVLPFVPFTMEEKKAIAAEAVYSLAGNTSKMMSPQDVESLVMKALPSYHPSEGARSLHRAISDILIDAI